MNEKEKYYIEEKCEDIEKLLSLDVLKKGNWVFRGQSNAEWSLEPSLFRHLKDNNIPEDNWVYCETLMIEEFKRYGFKYLKNPPEPANHLEWLSIIQHWGGKTRLLDFTSNIFTAVYFACNELEKLTDSAIWCINLDKLYEHRLRFLSGCDGYEKMVEDYFISNGLYTTEWDNTTLGMIHYQPLYKNDRMYSQDGLFLIPLHIKLSFEENLKFQLTKDGSNKFDKSAIIKIKIPNDKRFEFMEKIMDTGISGKSLFPDLSGVAAYSNFHIVKNKDEDSKSIINKLNAKIKNDIKYYVEKYGYFNKKVADSYHKLGLLMREKSPIPTILYLETAIEIYHKIYHQVESIHKHDKDLKLQYAFALTACGAAINENIEDLIKEKKYSTPQEACESAILKLEEAKNFYCEHYEKDIAYKENHYGKDNGLYINAKHHLGKAYYNMSAFINKKEYLEMAKEELEYVYQYKEIFSFLFGIEDLLNNINNELNQINKTGIPTNVGTISTH